MSKLQFVKNIINVLFKNIDIFINNTPLHISLNVGIYYQSQYSLAMKGREQVQ